MEVENLLFRTLATASIFCGVRLCSGGVLSGTPTASGTSSFTITATDAHSQTGSQAYSLTINAAIIPGRIYVANYTGNTVSVINGATNAVTATVSVGTNPDAVAVNASTNKVYVANQGSNTVSVINGATNAVTATVSIGTNPDAVAVNASTNTVYVTNNGGNTVSVINGVTNAVTATISVGSDPEGVAVGLW